MPTKAEHPDMEAEQLVQRHLGEQLWAVGTQKGGSNRKLCRRGRQGSYHNGSCL
jgi:hypothetical protein